MLVLISAIFMTVQNIIQKKILFKEHSSEFLTVFCLLMWIFLLPFASKIDFSIHKNTLLLIYIISLLSVFSWLFLLKAYRHMQVSSIEPLRNIGPLLVLFLAFIFLEEVIKPINLIGIFFLVIGAYLLEVYTNHGNIFKPLSLFKGKYVHFMIYSLLIAAVAVILLKKVLLKTNPLTVLFFTFFFASLNMLIIQFTFYKGMQDILHVLKTNGFLAAIAVIATIISDLTYYMAIIIPGTFLALILSVRRLSTLFVTIIGGEIFHETRLISKSIACIIMLIGVYFILI